MRYRADFSDRKIEPLDVRRRRQSGEGAQAMKDYRQSGSRTEENGRAENGPACRREGGERE